MGVSGHGTVSQNTGTVAHKNGSVRTTVQFHKMQGSQLIKYGSLRTMVRFHKNGTVSQIAGIGL